MHVFFNNIPFFSLPYSVYSIAWVSVCKMYLPSAAIFRIEDNLVVEWKTGVMLEKTMGFTMLLVSIQMHFDVLYNNCQLILIESSIVISAAVVAHTFIAVVYRRVWVLLYSTSFRKGCSFGGTYMLALRVSCA